LYKKSLFKSLIRIKAVTKASRNIATKGSRDSFVRRIFMAWKVESFYHFNSRKDPAPTPPAVNEWQVFFSLHRRAGAEAFPPRASAPALQLKFLHKSRKD
jgi:hypothetical protein